MDFFLLDDLDDQEVDHPNNHQLPVSFSTVYLRFLYSQKSNLFRDSNWWSTATVTDACKYYLNCARNNISYFENYVEADSDLSQNEKNEIFALYQLCTLFVSWNAIKEKKIREIIDIRKSLFFR